MINIYLDTETLPQADQRQSFIDEAKLSVKVPSDLTKPKLMAALGTTDKALLVPELKSMWIEEFGAKQAEVQGDEDWRKTSFNGAKGQLCVIGFAIEDGEIQTLSVDGFSESEMLSVFWKSIDELVGDHAFRFVAHNAKFDLPFIWHRSVINKVKPVYFMPHGRHGQHHYCTMEAWAGFNGRISMDDLATALGLDGKGDMDGSMVCDTWQEEPQKVVDYCADDVRMLREIYKRLNFQD